MRHPELRAALLPTFIAEAEEHLSTLDQGLVKLEGMSTEDQDLVQELFRAVHSLKGAARMVDVGGVERIAHAMEDLFGRVRDETLEPDSRIIDLLLSATDALRTVLAGEQGGEGLDPQLEEEIVSALRAAAEGQQFEIPRAGAADGQGQVVEETSSVPAGGASATVTAERGASVSTAVSSARTLRSGSGHIHVSAAAVDRLVEMTAELGVSARGLDTPLKMIAAGEQRLRRLTAELRKLRTMIRREPDSAVAQLAKAGDELAEWVVELARAGQVVRRRTEAHTRLVRGAQEAAQALRMLPVASLFDRLPRLVRDTARSCGKDVVIETSGGETELDREILEQLSDPLIHLVRNAVDHGIEPPEERRASGKPESGHLTVTAQERGSVVEIEVRDDGRGIDLERLIGRAVERGIIDTDAAQSRSDEELLQLVFASGLSTAERITELSGRGVGLDVVRANIEQLQGRVAVTSAAGEGTVFTLTVPLTLAGMFTVVVSCDGTLLGFPGATVDRLLRVAPDALGRVEGRPVVEAGTRPLPVVDLGALVGFRSGELSEGPLTIVVGGVAERRLGFIVDHVEGTQELVISGLGPQVQGLGMISGGAILPDGRPVVMLNVGAVIDAAARSSQAPAIGGQGKTLRRRRVVLADDSLTTRALEKAILEGAGYEVLAFADGASAWRALRTEQVDAVVSDIQMPHMDGFELTAKIRSDPRLRKLSVVLVTSLESQADKRRGLEAGADAYIVKRTFDQRELLEVLERLLGGEV